MPTDDISFCNRFKFSSCSIPSKTPSSSRLMRFLAAENVNKDVKSLKQLFGSCLSWLLSRFNDLSSVNEQSDCGMSVSDVPVIVSDVSLAVRRVQLSSWLSSVCMSCSELFFTLFAQSTVSSVSPGLTQLHPVGHGQLCSASTYPTDDVNISKHINSKKTQTMYRCIVISS